MSNQTTQQCLNLFDPLLHMNNISARIAFNTTAIRVVILMQSYEESANMSRCNFDRLSPLLNAVEMLSRQQMHEFLFGEFAENTIQPYNVMEIVL